MIDVYRDDEMESTPMMAQDKSSLRLSENTKCTALESNVIVPEISSYSRNKYLFNNPKHTLCGC